MIVVVILAMDIEQTKPEPPCSFRCMAKIRSVLINCRKYLSRAKIQAALPSPFSLRY